jgi:hypothetical protein
MTRASRIVLALFALLWGLSWVFARDLIRGLETLGVIERRGLVLSDPSDFAFSLVVLAGLCGLWALWRMAGALGGRTTRPAPVTVDEDPRYQELQRHKEHLLKELKELEFDRDLRKISEEDSALLERRLRREATSILRSLDEIDPVRLYGDRIRADLAQRQGTPAAEPALRASA